MSISVLRLLGERAAHKTLTQNSKVGGPLDIKLGFAMLKDRRVPFKPKFLAVGIGAALVALLLAVEFPLESLLAVAIPGLGLVVDALTDSMEAIIGTVGVATMLLPHLAPKLLTQQIRNERAGIIEATFVPDPPVVNAGPVRPNSVAAVEPMRPRNDYDV